MSSSKKIGDASQSFFSQSWPWPRKSLSMPTHVTELAIKGKDQTHPLHINNIDHTNKATRSQIAGANHTTKQGKR